MLYGNQDNDLLIGDNGTITVGNGIYNLDPGSSSGNGNDRLYGDDGDDALYGIGGNDELYGELGNDHLYGGDGNDKLFGNAGWDILIGGTNDDQLLGGDNDTTDDNAIDLLFGDNATIQQTPGSLAAIVTSVDPTQGGQDLIIAVGDDQIVGGSGGTDAQGVGGDTLLGSDRDNVILGDNGRITRNASGQVTEIFTLFDDIGGDDLIEGRGGKDIILGQGGNDRLIGGSSIANANDDVDYLFGGAGDDTIAGNNAIISNEPNPDDWTIQVLPGGVTTNYIFGDHGEITFVDSLQLQDRGIINRPITHAIALVESKTLGQEGNDFLAGSNVRDYSFGGLGNDRILGLGGDDLLVGDHGSIEFVPEVIEGGVKSTAKIIRTRDEAGGGQDTIWGGTGSDVIFGGGGRDTLSGGEGDDYIIGDQGLVDFGYAGDSNVGADTNLNTLDYVTTIASVNGDNDTIYGNEGNDTALGGTGNDGSRWNGE